MNRFILFVISIFLTSCTLVPKELSQMTIGTACIKGGMANFVRHFTSGEAHVGVNPQNNGDAGAYSEHCIPSGKREILVSGARGPYSGVNALIIVALQEGHRYRVRAIYTSGSYQFTIVDITELPESVTYEFTIPSGYYGKNILTGESGTPIDLTESDQ